MLKLAFLIKRLMQTNISFSDFSQERIVYSFRYALPLKSPILLIQFTE